MACGPPSITALISARLRGMSACANAASNAQTSPASPLIAARSGRMIGSGRKLRSSRAKRGHNPARRKEDLPAPEAPRITEKTRRRTVGQATQPVEPLDNLSLAAEENAGIFGLERLEATIRRTQRIVGWWPSKEPRIQPRFDKPGAKSAEPAARERDMYLSTVGEFGAAQAVIDASCEVHHLPIPCQLGRQVSERQILDEDAEHALVQATSKVKFAQTPVRPQPGAADKKKHRFAAIGSF